MQLSHKETHDNANSCSMWMQQMDYYKDNNNTKEETRNYDLPPNSHSHYRKRYGRFTQRRPTTTATICSGGAPPWSMLPSSYCSGGGGFYKNGGGHLTSASSGLKQGNYKEEKYGVSSTRWNPTPEQVMALQEMYERGVRSPSADEIQLITAKLSHFGKIEGKNVFYWFQNHKARERQKRRRQSQSSNSSSFDPLLKHATDLEANDKMEPSFAISNCHKAHKGSASMHKAVDKKSRNNGWTHLGERQNHLQLHKKKTRHSRTKKCSDTLLDLSFKPSDHNTNPQNEDLFKAIPERRNNLQMLQLFPSLDDDPDPKRPERNGDDKQEFPAIMFTPKQFYEFL